MGIQTNASSSFPRFEDLFCESFDSKSPETPERTFLDFFLEAARRAGFSYPDKKTIASQILKTGGRSGLPVVRQFFGEHDYYFRGTFHEGRVPRESWTGDLTWEEGAKLAFNASSRNGLFQVNGDVWMDGVEILHGLDIGGLTRRRRPLYFWKPIETTDKVRLLLPHFRHHGWPTYDLTDEMRRFGLGRSMLEPVPIEEVFTVYPDKAARVEQKIAVSKKWASQESIGKRFLKALMQSWMDQDSSELRSVIDEWFSGRSEWTHGPLSTLDDFQLTIDDRPPPTRERIGRTNLHLDWQRVLETLKSGRFLKFDFDGIHEDSYANFYDVPADLLIPNAEGSFDLRWSYDPAAKVTSILISDINVVAQSTLSLRGQVEIFLRYPDLAEINFENLEYEIPYSSGRLNSHLQVDFGGESPVIRKSWVEIDQLVIESEDGGPIQFRMGETAVGIHVDDGLLSFDYDPDRHSRAVEQEMELRGEAYFHGPKNRLDLSNLRVSIRSPLNLVDLKAEAQADLRIRSEGGSTHDIGGVRVALVGVSETGDRGPHLLATVRADSIPLFQQKLFFDSTTTLWSEPRGDSCRMKWNTQLALQNQKSSAIPVNLASALLGSSDFETVWLKVVPAFRQVFSDWTFLGSSEGEASFRAQGISALLEGLQRQSSFQTTRTGVSIKKGRREWVKNLACQWKGRKKEGSLRCKAKKVGNRVRIEKAKFLFPWDHQGFHVTNGEITIRRDNLSLQLIRGLDLILREPGRFRAGEFRTDTIGGLCLSGFVNPQAAALLGDQVELVQEGGEWVYLRRCGKRLPLNQKALLGSE